MFSFLSGDSVSPSGLLPSGASGSSGSAAVLPSGQRRKPSPVIFPPLPSAGSRSPPAPSPLPLLPRMCRFTEMAPFSRPWLFSCVSPVPTSRRNVCHALRKRISVHPPHPPSLCRLFAKSRLCLMMRTRLPLVPGSPLSPPARGLRCSADIRAGARAGPRRTPFVGSQTLLHVRITWGGVRTAALALGWVTPCPCEVKTPRLRAAAVFRDPHVSPKCRVREPGAQRRLEAVRAAASRTECGHGQTLSSER